jgi:8-amino-7-oxononanoate synthase
MSGDQGIINARIERQLTEISGSGLWRELVKISGLNFCSNDYLGLSQDAEIKAAAVRAVAESKSIASTGSRLLSGNARVWEQLEEEFAVFAGTASALYFSSGYLANVGLITSLLTKEDTVFSDALNHASLIDGIRLSGARKVIYPHCDMNVLEDLLLNHHSGGARLIVTESIFSMDGDRAPLCEMVDLAARYGAEIIVDEAHATGVEGSHGEGITAAMALENQVLAVVHTCGKALACMGAFVCGSTSLKQYLLNRARTFVFSTAMPAYFAEQICAALKRVQRMNAERAYLQQISSRFRAHLNKLGIPANSCSQIVPLIVGRNETASRLATYLEERGFGIRAIRPPTVPAGSARLRFSLTTQISEADVDRLADSINSYFSCKHEECVGARK